MGVYASPGEVPLGILGGGVPRARPVLQILTLFQTKKCHFSHVSDLVSNKLCHHYLD